MRESKESHDRARKSELVLELAAVPDGDPKLLRIAAILSGNDTPERPSSLRLMRICEAVRISGLSRSTIYRMIEAGRLRTVEIRPGASPRIPEDELRRMVETDKRPT